MKAEVKVMVRILLFHQEHLQLLLYFSGNFEDRDNLLEKLEKHKTGKGCVHIKILSDIDKSILTKNDNETLKHIKEPALANPVSSSMVIKQMPPAVPRL